MKGQVSQHSKVSANVEDECKELQSELAASRDGFAKLENDFESLSTEFDKMKEELQKAKKEVD